MNIADIIIVKRDTSLQKYSFDTACADFTRV